MIQRNSVEKVDKDGERGRKKKSLKRVESILAGSERSV